MKTDRVKLKYDGGHVSEGSMDSYAAAANIIAFSDFLGVLTRVEFGDKAILKSEIKGVERGSFLIDFGLQLSGVVTSLLAVSSDPKQLFDLAKECLEAWKFLEGTPPQKVTKNEDGTYQIINQGGKNTIVNGNVLVVLGDETAGKAVEQFIGTALESQADTLDILPDDESKSISINSEERKYYKHLATEKTILDTIHRMALRIVSPVFKEGNKWKFHDGHATINASILDEEYLAKIDRGDERFGKGDTLLCEVRVCQTEKGAKLDTSYEVIKVLEHKAPSENHKLF